MTSDVLLYVMLSLPTSYALPGVRVGRSCPSSAHAVPFDTGPQPGCRSGPGNGQAQQPLAVCCSDPRSCSNASLSPKPPLLATGPKELALIFSVQGFFS